jgi:hypothetical protein
MKNNTSVVSLRTQRIDINPLRDCRYVADATRYAYGSICLLRKRGIDIISKPTEREVISNLPKGKYIELSVAKHIDN